MRPNPTILSQSLEKRFCADGVKLGGVQKNNFKHLKSSWKTFYVKISEIRFCAGAKETGGVQKNNFEGFRLHLI
jgi:hypothetical protein